MVNIPLTAFTSQNSSLSGTHLRLSRAGRPGPVEILPTWMGIWTLGPTGCQASVLVTVFHISCYSCLHLVVHAMQRWWSCLSTALCTDNNFWCSNMPWCQAIQHYLSYSFLAFFFLQLLCCPNRFVFPYLCVQRIIIIFVYVNRITSKLIFFKMSLFHFYMFIVFTSFFY